MSDTRFRSVLAPLLIASMLLAASGCVGEGADSGENPQGEAPAPGVTERPADTPYPEEEAGLSNFSREAEPSAPADRFISVETAYEWYEEGSAVFVDSRPISSFNDSHVTGALPSPATPEYRLEPDPVEELSKDRRIVTYCACPNHLATLRAEQLTDAGYTEVYVLEDGYFDWRETYPDAVSSGAWSGVEATGSE